MRILLIAYEFPPSPSPQSLRWTYLARELDALGHEIHVLTADLGGDTPGLPELPESIRVHRTFPGLLRGALAMHRDYRKRHPRNSGIAVSSGLPSANASALAEPIMPLRPPRNWKQRVSETVQACVAVVCFPDIRGEWRYWGRRELQRLLRHLDVDVIVSSHEPATTLELVMSTRNLDTPWVADLGDPVLAPYTPQRWKSRSRRIERDVCRQAAAITVTSEATADVLRQRHGRSHGIHVVTQGFDSSARQPAIEDDLFSFEKLELLYTGSLYAFRRIDALLDALALAPDVRLSIAAVTVPEAILTAAKLRPHGIRLLGFLPHRTALALQREADVLVNLANNDSVQIPGKFYEYLGSGRPILHLGDTPDPVASRILELRRGWICQHRAEDIAALLNALSSAKAAKRLDAGLKLDGSEVAEHSWRQLGIGMEHILTNVVSTHKSSRQTAVTD